VGVQLFYELIDKFRHALRIRFIRYQLAELTPLFFFFNRRHKSTKASTLPKQKSARQAIFAIQIGQIARLMLAP